MIKINILKKNEFLTFCILFLLTLLLSGISIPLISNAGVMPDYFLALFIPLIATRFMKMNIYILFFLGLIIDLLVGELIGQYGLILITIYFTNFVLNKYLLFKSLIMRVLQHLILTTIGIIILFTSSLSYELNINLGLFPIKLLTTFLLCIFYAKLIQSLRRKP
jgi:rod shape-determining protein MreD